MTKQGVHPPNAPRVVVFAKAPLPGRAKTRLIPALGAEGAARLARRMLGHALAQAMAARVGAVELCMSPGPEDAAWHGVELAGPGCSAPTRGRATWVRAWRAPCTV
jgi:hypothetical protein